MVEVLGERAVSIVVIRTLDSSDTAALLAVTA